MEAEAIDNTTLGDGTGGGNIATAGSVSFIVDNTPPSGSIVWPSASAAVSSATIQMTGSATDDLAGVQTVAVEISTGTLGTKSCWSGAGWTASGCVNDFISTTTANPWVYTISSSALVTGNLYYIRLQLTDFAGNVFTSPTSTFTYNTTAPTVTITPQPPNNGLYSAVQVSTQLAGTTTPASVTGVVVSTVSLTLQDLTTGTSYYNGNSWVTSVVSFPAQGTVNVWTYNSATLTFVNDHQYQLTAAATDNAGNTGSINANFVYDVQAPTSTITSPVPPYMTALNTITGTANDNPGGALTNPSGISTSAISVAIKQIGFNWWNGTNFTASANPVYFAVANTTTTNPNNWTYSIPGALQNALATGSQYRIISRATDNAANSEFPLGNAFVPAGVGFTVLYDTAPPVSLISFPANGSAYQGVATISGTADDTSTGSGVQTVQIALLDSINDYWNGSTWVLGSPCQIACTPWLSAAFVGVTSGTWSYGSLTSAFSTNTTYKLYVRAVDNASNVPTTPTFTSGAPVANVTFVVDFSTPISQVTSPANGSSFSTVSISTISGTATDLNIGGSGIQFIQMRIGRSDGKFFNLANTTWEAPPTAGQNFQFSTILAGTKTNYTWTTGVPLGTFGDGYQYNLESQSKDFAGNLEVDFTTTTFTVDLASPTAVITYPSAGGYVNQTGYVQGTAADALVPPGNTPSGINAVEVRISTNSFGSFWTGSSWTATSNTWLTANLSPSATFWWLPQTPGSRSPTSQRKPMPSTKPAIHR